MSNRAILKKAESIILNYMRENSLKIIKDRRYKVLRIQKRRKTVNVVINILLYGSIALLIFLAGKFIK